LTAEKKVSSIELTKLSGAAESTGVLDVVKGFGSAAIGKTRSSDDDGATVMRDLDLDEIDLVYGGKKEKSSKDDKKKKKNKEKDKKKKSKCKCKGHCC
jgi:hypothetical protein